MPHATVMMQRRQRTINLEEWDLPNEDDSQDKMFMMINQQKMKSTLTDVISQIPNTGFVAFSILGKVTSVETKTANASIGL